MSRYRVLGHFDGGPLILVWWIGKGRRNRPPHRRVPDVPEFPGTGLFVSDQVVQKSDTEREPDARDVPDERPVEPEGRRERVAGRAPDASQGAPAKGAREGEGLTTGQLCEVSARDGRP